MRCARRPCPLLAIANCLLLRNAIQLSAHAPDVTQVRPGQLLLFEADLHVHGHLLACEGKPMQAMRLEVGGALGAGV